MIKDESISLRVSSQTKDMAKEICEQFRLNHKVHVSISAYFRGIIEVYVNEQYEKLKKGEGKK